MGGGESVIYLLLLHSQNAMQSSNMGFVNGRGRRGGREAQLFSVAEKNSHSRQYLGTMKKKLQRIFLLEAAARIGFKSLGISEMKA